MWMWVNVFTWYTNLNAQICASVLTVFIIHLREIGYYQYCILYTLLQAPQYGDVRVTVEKIPSVVQLEQQFDVALAITNIW